jgi:hypothetical protein
MGYRTRDLPVSVWILMGRTEESHRGTKAYRGRGNTDPHQTAVLDLVLVASFDSLFSLSFFFRFLARFLFPLSTLLVVSVPRGGWQENTQCPPSVKSVAIHLATTSTRDHCSGDWEILRADVCLCLKNVGV